MLLLGMAVGAVIMLIGVLAGSAITENKTPHVKGWTFEEVAKEAEKEALLEKYRQQDVAQTVKDVTEFWNHSTTPLYKIPKQNEEVKDDQDD